MRRKKVEKGRGEKEKMIEMKRLVEKWEIWDEEEKAARPEAEARRLVLEHFHM